MSESPLLDVRNLKKNFTATKKILRAVDDVSFIIRKGETFGLVGESGCGKSTLGKTVLRLLEPDSGQIYFEGRDVLKIKNDEMRHLRKDMQIIFQDPFGSLNPRMTIYSNILRAIKVHGLYRGKERQRVDDVLSYVDLSSEDGRRHPHEFSGGQRQRIAIARALATNPKFIVLDEPTSALDVSVQARILNLLVDMQEKFGFTYLFISHDLSIVKQMCDVACVMYLGKIVEMAPVKALFKLPTHPYTRTLLSALLIPDLEYEKVPITGEPPSLFDVHAGCSFCMRCPNKNERCEKQEPILVDIGEEHFVSCHECAQS
jgi:oligopeptide/dipeptide ABC transporter ATP-binding protein